MEPAKLQPPKKRVWGQATNKPKSKSPKEKKEVASRQKSPLTRLDGRPRPQGPVKSITFDKDLFLERFAQFKYKPIYGDSEETVKVHALGAARAYPLVHILL